jgi:TolB protein
VRRALFVALALLAIAAGCGDDQDAEPAAATAQESAVKELGVDAPGIIAFRRYTDAAEEQGVIFTIKPDGSGEKQVTRPAEDESDEFPQMSADGTRLSFDRCAADVCRVHTAAIDGTDVQEVEVECALEPVCDTAGAAWSPDGKRLAFTRSSGGVREGDFGDQIRRSELVVTDADGTDLRVVGAMNNFQGDLQSPSWSPDGRTLAFDRFYSVFHERPGRNVDVVPTRGGTAEHVTPSALDAGDGPEWSPDGNSIVFRVNASDEEGSTSAIATIQPDRKGLQKLAPFGKPRPVLSSAYSPDGEWIVFAAEGEGNTFDLFVMTADGADPRPLTRTPVRDSAPDWAGGP